MKEDVDSLVRRVNALEAGQRKMISLLRMAFPAPSEIEIDELLRRCGNSGVLVMDEWNKRKRLEAAMPRL